MAFGFPAYARATRRYGRSREALKEPVARALSALGWTAFGNWSGSHFLAEVGVNLWSWGEKVHVTINADGSVWMESKCRFVTQCFDWGKNQANVDTFFAKVAQFLGDALP